MDSPQQLHRKLNWTSERHSVPDSIWDRPQHNTLQIRHPAWPKPIHNGVSVPTKEEREKARQKALVIARSCQAPTYSIELPEPVHNGVTVPASEERERARQAALLSKNTVKGQATGPGVVYYDFVW